MLLTQSIKQDSGYSWVMDHLNCRTPFGRALAHHPVWYADGEALERELENISLAWDYLAQDVSSGRVLTVLSAFRDIRGSLSRSPQSAMDLVELFEVKHFLLALDRLCQALEGAPDFSGVTLSVPVSLLELLDPSGRRLPGFSVSEFDPLVLACPRSEAEERELAVRHRLTDRLLAERAVLLAQMDGVGRLDLTLAKGALARRFDCARPAVSPDGVIHASELIHPEVAQSAAVGEVGFTPVTLDLPQGAAVITGVNMGGKSVALKTVTLNLLLLQTGFFIFGRAFSAPLFQEVELICTDKQSAEQGLSSFGAEITAINQLLERCRGRRFFLALDEFARGTNPTEGGALCRALTRYLCTLPCTALLTTHYDGVADAGVAHYRVAGLSQLPDGSCGHKDLRALMDYRLLPAEPGEPCPRDALRVCQMLGLEPELLDLFSREI